jgi:hypothetical protein
LERAALTITDKLATERRSLKEVEQQLKSIDKVLIRLPYSWFHKVSSLTLSREAQCVFPPCILKIQKQVA